MTEKWNQQCTSLLLWVPCSLDGLTTTNTSSAAGRDQADLLAGWGVAGHGRRVTNVLMVTTTMGMLHGVSGHTTNLGPAVALAAEAVVRVTGLEDWLLDTASTSDDADHGAAAGRDRLLLPAGELQAGAPGLGVVGDDDAVVTGCAGKGAAVAGLGLNVADDATFGDVSQWEDVSDGERGLLSAEDGLSGEHTLGCDEELLCAAVLVRVAELDAGEGCTSAGLVLDGLHDASHEAVALCVVEDAELGWAQALVAVNLVHGTLTLTASEDCLSHIDELLRQKKPLRKCA